MWSFETAYHFLIWNISSHTTVRSLLWRHNGRNGVSNHQLHHCLLNRLFKHRSKKTLKLRVIGLCAGNLPVTGEFPAQMASNAENVVWWRNHDCIAVIAWWRHQMETFSALLAICAGNSPVHGEFPAQRPVTRNFDVYFDMHPNNRLSKQSWGWWFET